MSLKPGYDNQANICKAQKTRGERTYLKLLRINGDYWLEFRKNQQPKVFNGEVSYAIRACIKKQVPNLWA